MCNLYYPKVSQQNFLNFSDWRFFSFATGVNDTGGQPWSANISANFRKNSKRSKWDTLGLGGNWLMKKTRSKKSPDTVPLSILITNNVSTLLENELGCSSQILDTVLFHPATWIRIPITGIGVKKKRILDPHPQHNKWHYQAVSWIHIRIESNPHHGSGWHPWHADPDPAHPKLLSIPWKWRCW